MPVSQLAYVPKRDGVLIKLARTNIGKAWNAMGCFCVASREASGERHTGRRQ